MRNIEVRTTVQNKIFISYPFMVIEAERRFLNSQEEERER